MPPPTECPLWARRQSSRPTLRSSWWARRTPRCTSTRRRSTRRSLCKTTGAKTRPTSSFPHSASSTVRSRLSGSYSVFCSPPSFLIEHLLLLLTLSSYFVLVFHVGLQHNPKYALLVVSSYRLDVTGSPSASDVTLWAPVFEDAKDLAP